MKIINWIFNVFLRIIFGIIGIFALNEILTWSPWKIAVGVNLETVGTIAILGVPGFVALYGIMFCIREI